jgi:DNA-binding transcriptional LysR family regulator
VALEALAGQPFLAREGGSGTAASVARLLAERGLRLPEHRTVMVLGSTQAIVSAVERGLGLGWVSSRALEDRNPRRVVSVRLIDVPLRRPLSLVRDPQRILPPAATAFMTWVCHQRGGEARG